MKTNLRKTFLAIFVGASLLAPTISMAEDEEYPPVTFHKKKMTIDHTKLTVELADNPDRHEHGLMFRKKLSDDEGMLFIFKKAEPQSFWMRNTLIPLSIGYFDAAGTLFQVIDMEPASPMDLHPPVYKSLKPAKYALEVSKGWFIRKKIKVGITVKMP